MTKKKTTKTAPARVRGFLVISDTDRAIRAGLDAIGGGDGYSATVRRLVYAEVARQRLPAGVAPEHPEGGAGEG